MDDSRRNASQFAPDDTTREPPVEPRPSGHRRVELVEGSSPELSLQTQSLLQTRLRSAALVLCVGSEAFLLKRALYDRVDAATDPALAFDDHILFLLHVTNVLSLGLIAAMLWHWKRNWSMRALRLFELATFGSTTLLFAAVQHYSTIATASRYNFVDVPIGIWCGLVLAYGMLIPNSWRRAAVVIGVLCLAPIATLAVDSLWLNSGLLSADHFLSLALTMAVLYGTTVYGTHTIGRLRREVFEARQFGQYRLRHRIGVGGMGEVYLAEHQLLRRRCAIKLIRPGKAADPRALARFEREVRATATLTHWNTVEIFDFGRTSDGAFYYVMEYLPGLSVRDLVERYGPLPPGRAIHLLEQTCDALHEAHAIGLIHRDVKPGNIFVAQRGGVYDVAKLLDFGLVRPATTVRAAHLSALDEIVGTPLFMSPEQATGSGELDERSDIYAMGAVAYFLLTGQPPFDREGEIAVMIAHARDPVVPPSRVRPGVPEDLDRVVSRCLAKAAAERYPDAASLERDLAACSCAGNWDQEHSAGWWRDYGRDPAQRAPAG
jgi:serine/threonine-protein kinase